MRSCFCTLVLAAFTFCSSEAAADLPPPDECVVNADCAECTVCQGGRCIGIGALSNCHCHDECGAGSCRLLHLDRPLCGGMCAPDPPDSDLPCGDGHDVLVVRELDVTLGNLDGGPERIESEPDDPMRAEPTGCDCRTAAGTDVAGAIGPWLAIALVLALRRRR